MTEIQNIYSCMIESVFHMMHGTLFEGYRYFTQAERVAGKFEIIFPGYWHRIIIIKFCSGPLCKKTLRFFLLITKKNV